MRFISDWLFLDLNREEMIKMKREKLVSVIKQKSFLEAFFRGRNCVVPEGCGESEKREVSMREQAPRLQRQILPQREKS